MAWKILTILVACMVAKSWAASASHIPESAVTINMTNINISSESIPAHFDHNLDKVPEKQQRFWFLSSLLPSFLQRPPPPPPPPPQIIFISPPAPSPSTSAPRVNLPVQPSGVAGQEWHEPHGEGGTYSPNFNALQGNLLPIPLYLLNNMTHTGSEMAVPFSQIIQGVKEKS